MRSIEYVRRFPGRQDDGFSKRQDQINQAEFSRVRLWSTPRVSM
jgi:hypothetical protein